MGLGMRIFIVKDDGSLERLPFGRYNRLLQHDARERLLQYASKRVRCAVIVVESKNRIPVEILKSQYSYLSFDSDGRLLEEGDERQVRLAMDMLEPVIADKRQDRWSMHGTSLLGSDTPGSICGNRLLRSRRLSGKRFSVGLKLTKVEIGFRKVQLFWAFR